MVIICLVPVWTFPAQAAKIEAIASGDGKMSAITIEGALEFGDERRFVDLALANPNSLVVFQSDGGNLFAGIEIGKAIRLKGFNTLVPDNFRCASACALAWLGGQRRMMSNSALIGFHAASNVNTGEVTSSGNAAIGAYLNQLGLSAPAINYITEPSPSDIRWLNPISAKNYGIDVDILDLATAKNNDGPPKAPNNLSPVSPPTQQNPARPTKQDVTRKFFENYFLMSGRDNDTVVAYLSGVYGANVNYYGKDVSIGSVISDKTSFFNRWPSRTYIFDASKALITCSEDSCQFAADVAWKMFSPKLSSTSEGTAATQYSVEFKGQQLLITSETSKVISRKVISSAASISSPLSSTLGQPTVQFSQPLIGVLLPPYCHMEYCNYSSIESRELDSKSNVGELYLITTKGWSSYHPNGYDIPAKKVGGNISKSYVLCSATKPAVIFENDGKWLMHRLAPGEVGGIFGYNSSDYTTYFAVCHGIAIDSAMSDKSVSLGKSLGYKVPPSIVEQIELDSPRSAIWR